MKRKRAKCPRCQDPDGFVLQTKDLRLAVPHCEDCTQGKKTMPEVTFGDIIL